MVTFRVLPDVQGGQVETDRIHDPSDTGNRPLGEKAATVFPQRLFDECQVSVKFSRRLVAAVPIQGGFPEPPVDGLTANPVGLRRVVLGGRSAQIGQVGGGRDE